MIRVAMLSFWHVHGKDYAREAEEHPDTEIAAVWDEDPERGRAEAEKRGVPFYERLDELLARADIDGVIVDAPTNMHYEVMMAAVRAGKHIFTEKVIAATLREAEAIVREAERAGVRFVVAMRRLPFASTRAIKAVIDDGLIGGPTLVSVRDSHSGVLPSEERPRGFLSDSFLDAERAQGGALIDMCHPMYLMRYFLGMPESVSATFGYVTGRPVEDIAVATLQYASGAVGIVQSGYVTRVAPFSIEVHGTQGSALYSETGIGERIVQRQRGEQGESLNGPDGKIHLRSTRIEHPGWLVQDVTAEAAPKPFDQWVAHIQQGTSAVENNSIGLDLSALIEAAYQSAKTGLSVRLDALTRA